MSSRNRQQPAPRVNGSIRAQQVLLIDAAGGQQGVVALGDALAVADEAGLDLVEVAAGPPPVCRVLDYGKWRYEQSRRAKPKAPPALKEVKVRLNIAEHDLATKLRKLSGFVAAGHRVRFVVMLRGREISRPSGAVELAREVIGRVAEAAAPTGEPQVAGRDVVVMFDPAR